MTRPDYVPNDADVNSSIAREGYEERERKKTDIGKKLHKAANNDEQTAISKHSEGFCYGCNTYDHIISTLVYGCNKCMERRGKTGLLALVFHKPSEEVCDFCGRWSKPFDTWQINCSFCLKCMERVGEFHRQYKKDGGKKSHPLYKSMRRKYGKDYDLMYSNGARSLGI